MKMKPEHYEALEAAIGAISVPCADALRARATSPERLRWDMLWASRFDVSVLYPYLTDAQIDTALRRIVGTEIGK